MRAHSFSMLRRSLGAWAGSTARAEAAVRMTARGERSSWEAAWTNSSCLRWFSSMGRRARRVKNQAKRASRHSPPRVTEPSRASWPVSWTDSGAVERTTTTPAQPEGRGMTAAAAR